MAVARSLGITEAAEFLGVPKKTLYAKYQTWGIPHFRIGRRLVFRLEELEQWFQQQREAS